MIFWIALVGLFAGIALNELADQLPRFAGAKIAPHTYPHRAPAVWRWIAARELSGDGIAVELLTAGLWAWLYARLGNTPDFFVLAILVAFFLLIALMDLRYRVILNGLIFPALAGVLLWQIFAGANWLVVLLGGGFGLAIFAAAAIVRPGELGGGDVKLAALIGVLFGFPYVLWALLIGVLAGGGAVIVFLVKRRGGWQTRIPYAPFLCLGAIIALFYNPVAAIYPVAVWHVW